MATGTTLAFIITGLCCVRIDPSATFVAELQHTSIVSSLVTRNAGHAQTPGGMPACLLNPFILATALTDMVLCWICPRTRSGVE